MYLKNTLTCFQNRCNPQKKLENLTRSRNVENAFIPLHAPSSASHKHHSECANKRLCENFNWSLLILSLSHCSAMHENRWRIKNILGLTFIQNTFDKVFYWYCNQAYNCSSIIYFSTILRFLNLLCLFIFTTRTPGKTLLWLAPPLATNRP